jgi:hypothetical protein
MVKVQTHEGVAWFQYCQQYCCVSLCARVWLNVGILSTEKFANAVDSKLLNLVDYLATTIVTVARITLGILVGKVRSHGFHNLVAYEVLTRNQLNAFQLALMLFLNQLKDCVVSVHCFVYWV